MLLSRDFDLNELTCTSTGLSNRPGNEELAKLKELASLLLQPIRDRWGRIRVTSAFRRRAVNSAVGGSPTSQHCFGEAADIIPLEADIDTVFRWIVDESGLDFGQCINEEKGKNRWIHISLPREGKINLQALVYDGKKYSAYAG